MAIQIPDSMNGVLAIAWDENYQIEIKTFVASGPDQYYRHRVTPERAIEIASELLAVALKAQYYKQHMNKD